MNWSFVLRDSCIHAPFERMIARTDVVERVQRSTFLFFNLDVAVVEFVLLIHGIIPAGVIHVSSLCGRAKHVLSFDLLV